MSNARSSFVDSRSAPVGSTADDAFHDAPVHNTSIDVPSDGLLNSDSQDSAGWGDHVWWGLLALTGLMVYEITARPAFGIAIACLKFGWNDFLTACWLLRRDPHAGRARTCFLFYIAAGLWKVTVTAFIVTGCLIGLVAILGEKQPRELWHLAVTAAAGISLLAVVPLLGAISAHKYGVKVWIDSSVHQSRRVNHWPPVANGFNAVGGLLFPALLVPTLIVALISFRCFGPVSVPPAIFALGILTWALFHGITAGHPDDCWDDDLLPEHGDLQILDDRDSAASALSSRD